jgi:hypothetical protein
VAGRQLVVAVAIIAVVAVAGGCGTATPSPSTPSAVPVSSPPGTADPSAAPSAAPDRTATPAPSREVFYQATEDLRVGDCYEPVEDADDQTLLAAIIVPCEQPHPNEVFGLGDLAGGPDAPFPGVDPVDDDAIELCDSAFESYVGVALDNSRYSYVYYTPTEESWAGGDRVVMCSVEDGGRLIEGSVEGTER